LKTVICHFYNEEWLLPWWLKHHKQIFDHGVMINYDSTDRSVEIIKELCPHWAIIDSRNANFADSVAIDKEVMDIEKVVGGWRMALNITEFLYGNTDHLKSYVENPAPTQYLIGNYVFVDMEDPDRGQTILDHKYPLWKQRYWGYNDFANTGSSRGGIMSRMNRSLHNYPVTYKGGRHWGGVEYPKSFDDLVIFYYGWADASEGGMKRKTQIATEKAGTGPHTYNKDQFLDFLRTGHRPISEDLRSEIASILEHNRRITGQEF
jgi:hypothetical protein